MQHILGFSGGKDSTALICWAKENLEEFTAVFCDTGWEHPLTYAYIQEINGQLLDGKLVTLKSEKYTGFEDLVLKRKMVPGVRSRFCTQELKIFPLHKYYESLDDEVTSYQGIRADESDARARMSSEQWVDDAGGYLIKRPLLWWTAEQCFAMAAKHNVKPNPLYLLGAQRVGCWPCIMVNKRELKNLFGHTPEILQRLTSLEEKLNEGRMDNWRAFFQSNFIPARFCSKTLLKDRRSVPCPTVQDVYDYLMWEDDKQLSMFDKPASTCMSFYNLCE